MAQCSCQYLRYLRLENSCASSARQRTHDNCRPEAYSASNSSDKSQPIGSTHRGFVMHNLHVVEEDTRLI